MQFKKWLENWADLDTKAEEFFGRKNINKGMDFNQVLKSLKLKPFKGQPKVIGEGSTATVYENPHNPRQAIKVTGDKQDAGNFNKILKKGLKHPCIVHCYNVAQLNNQAYSLLLDRIEGQVFAYGSMFTHLVQGDDFEEPAEAAQSILYELDSTRRQVFERVGMQDSQEERQKLSSLFDGMAKLERIGIHVFDTDENIIDAGDRYVLIDIGR